jgi:uncharacterized protein (TIGR02246 family)
MELLSQLKAIEEIKALKARYCRSVDLGDWEHYSSLWSEDGCFCTASGRRVHGRRAIVDLLREVTEGKPTLHLAYLPEISIASERSASAIWGLEYYVAAQMPDPAARGYGFSYDDYVRVGEQWLVSRVEMRQSLVTAPSSERPKGS